MKKVFYKILICSPIIIGLNGCENFLNQEVLGNSTEENFYDTEYKLEAALNATYDILQTDQFNESDWRFGEACGDDVIGNDEGLGSTMGQLVHFRFNTSNEWIEKRWEINYKGVHRANLVIANVNRVKLSTNDFASYTRVREILGQAKFLRALYYFNLVKTFGGVPIRPEEESMDGFVSARNTKEEVYAYIEKDLREAAIMLPARYGDENAGKADCGAALALLMKVLMYQATPGMHSEKWEEMVNIGEYFIDGKSMTFGEILHYDKSNGEDWENLRKRLWFKPKEKNTGTDPYETPQTELTSIQNAYSIQYRDYYGKSLKYYEQFYNIGEFGKGSVFEIVFKESADGSTADKNEGTSIYGKMWVNDHNPAIYLDDKIKSSLFGSADPRAQYAMAHMGYTPDDNEIIYCGPGKIVSLKWYTPIKDRPQYNGDNSKNRRLIRYADVVLMYAESLNECGFGARALEQLNKNKSQANTIDNSNTLYVAGGYGQMRDQIWEERRKELCFEWDRFFDIVRQGRAADVLHEFGKSRPNNRGLFFRKGINEIFPIPQKEIDLSNGVVEQNPGY